VAASWRALFQEEAMTKPKSEPDIETNQPEPGESNSRAVRREDEPKNGKKGKEKEKE
jgi:hypothetical protein